VVACWTINAEILFMISSPAHIGLVSSAMTCALTVDYRWNDEIGM